jgi:predicted nucleotidyltransferase
VLSGGKLQRRSRVQAIFTGHTRKACVPSTTRPQGRKTDDELKMLLEDLQAQREAIAGAARDYGARRIRVFGSVARGEETADSDVDFLVDLPRGYDLFKQRLPLVERLASITGRRVDLIPEHELNRHIRTDVLAEAVDL